MAKKRTTTRITVEELDNVGAVVSTESDIETIRTQITSENYRLNATVVSKVDHVARTTQTYTDFDPTNDKPEYFARIKKQTDFNQWQDEIFTEYQSLKTQDEARFSG